MISNTRQISKLAAVLAAGAILNFGGGTAAQAGSNDSGPFRYTTQSNQSNLARAAAYREAWRNVQIQHGKRVPTHAAPDAYGSYAARELIPSTPAQGDFPRAAQGGW
jgi:hypothetical protein